MTRRYDQYPLISAALRDMSDGQRQTVAYWHGMLITALEGYVPRTVKEVKIPYDGKFQTGMMNAAAEGAEMALNGWLRTMRDVAGIVIDPSEADWCCKPGMLASPDPCPQHGFDPTGNYDLGTVIEREYGDGKQRAVYVISDNIGNRVWRVVDMPLEYTWSEVVHGGWTVVGRA